MTTQTIHFENSREAHDIAGSSGEVLLAVQKAFSVRLTARDAWIEVEGDEEQAAKTVRLFNALRQARNKGIRLRKHEIMYSIKAFCQGREDELCRLNECRIDVGHGKAPVFPRTFGQWRYVESIRLNDVVFGIGPAGTGKTYLAMAMAVAAFSADQVSRIILTRPAIEAGETLGFLPGDMHAKVLPYLRPLYDALYDMMNPNEIERNLDRGLIEVAPLAYMRGRTLNHAFVILDEAQNTTREQMLMFLTRLGFDSKCVVTGDLTQIDLPPSKSSGLREARETLTNIKGISIVDLDESDVVRHELVQKIIKAYRINRGEQTTS